MRTTYIIYIYIYVYVFIYIYIVHVHCMSLTAFLGTVSRKFHLALAYIVSKAIGYEILGMWLGYEKGLVIYMFLRRAAAAFQTELGFESGILYPSFMATLKYYK